MAVTAATAESTSSLCLKPAFLTASMDSSMKKVDDAIAILTPATPRAVLLPGFNTRVRAESAIPSRPVAAVSVLSLLLAAVIRTATSVPSTTPPITSTG
ncbi:MAG: hypothetical protein OWQ48_04405 [Desulfurococcus sp.]|nr:hypothetical protein [Desulfurococcus sp.]